MKPQSVADGLDGADRAPHPSVMTTSDKDPKPQLTEREQKLAQALRANLRRRKAGEHPSPPPKSGDKA